VTTRDPHGAIEAVWRIEQTELIAGMARLVRDVGLAEELAQDALVAACEFHISEREHEADQVAAPVFRGERVPPGTAFGSEFKNSPAE
jgi:hypothetical protein